MHVGLLSGLAAALLSWLINGRVVTAYGDNGVAFVGPAVEEGLKTGLAILFGAPLLVAHMVFGLIEAGWELYTYRRIPAGLIAFFSHGIYGWVTKIVADHGGLILGLLAGYGVHVLWNYWVILRSNSAV